MRLFLADMIRRRVIVLSVVGIGMLLGVLGWAVEGMDEAAAIRPLIAGFAVAMAFSMGAQATARYLERGVCYLPISRRDLWVARWIFSVGVAPLCTWPGLLAPALVQRTADATEAALLSVLYTVAYAGFGCGLIVLATRPIRASAPWRQLDAGAASLADMALPLGMAVPMFGQQFTSWRLPMRITDITAGFGASIVIGLAAGVAAYFYTPPPVGRTVRSYAPAPATARAEAASTRRRHPARRRRGPSLGGLPLLLAHEYRWAMLIGGGLALLSVAAVMVIASFMPSKDTLADLIRTELRFLDGVHAAPGLPALAAFGALIWYGFFVGSLAVRFPAMLRHLRVLPISAARVNLLLLCWPAAIWLSAGLILYGAASLILGEIVPARMPMLLALTGLSALASALTLRVTGTGIQRIFLLFITVSLVPVLHLFPVPPPSILALVGGAGLAVAAALNHITLRRSSTYRVRNPELAAAFARLGL